MVLQYDYDNRVLHFTMPRYRSLGRALIALLLLSLLSSCAHIDRKRFSSLQQAATELRERVVATHRRVKRLQEAVFRAKISLAPELYEASLDRPDWLDTGTQFRSREEVLDEVVGFIEGLREVADRQSSEQMDASARKLSAVRMRPCRAQRTRSPSCPR